LPLLWLVLILLTSPTPAVNAQPQWAGFVDIARDTPQPLGGLLIPADGAFVIGGVGFSAFSDTPGAVGDNLTFRYELLTGDFDKCVRLISLISDPTLDPVARAGLMVRASTNANSLAFEIAAANPATKSGDFEGANRVRVAGRARVDQLYATGLSRDYPGVRDALPNQWLRIRRVGDAWAFFVGTNGVHWALISEQYQVFPPQVLVGVFAAPDHASGTSRAMAAFADYGDFLPADTEPPRLVSVGTLDKQTIGVKFSEPVRSMTATLTSSYAISQGTITDARLGIGGNTVYLTVSGLTANTFTVTVTGNVPDLAGNAIPTGSAARGKVSPWISADIGFIQDPNARPTPGDDPYVQGQAVVVSSDPNPEIELIGGGSNLWNLGDYLHYLYREYTGDFDVAVAVERFDKRGFAGGYGNGGIHVRSALTRSDTAAVGENTEVPCYANITYHEAAAAKVAAIQLHRAAPGDDYRLSRGVKPDVEIGGLLGYYDGLRCLNASGDIELQCAPTQAKWLRVKRVGQTFSSLVSYNGREWLELPDSSVNMTNLPQKVLVGFAYHNDTGYGLPPEANTRAGNGTTSQNESNYGVVRISALGDYHQPRTGPGLQVQRYDNQFQLSWTGNGYVLLSAAQSQGPYLPAAGVPVSIDGEIHTVTLNPGSACAFYRLAE
jgi:hypothetical protein